MDNEKRILLSIVLSVVVLFIYQSYFAPTPPQTNKTTSVSEQPIAQNEVKREPPIIEHVQTKKDTVINSSNDSTSGLSDKPDKEIRVSTNLYTAVFSSNLARLSSFKLLKYKDNISSPDVVKLFKKIFSSRSDENLSDKSAKSNNKEMINLNQKDDLPLRSSFINSNGKAFNYKPFESDKDNLILDRSIMENSLIFKQSDQEGFEIQKKFLFRENDYIIDFTITFSNSSNSTREGNAFVEWTAPIPSTKSSGFFGTSDTSDISRFTYFINGKVEKIELKDAKDKRTLEGEFLWASIEEKYFMSAIMPRSQKPSQVRIGKAQDSDIISYQLLYPHIALNPGDQISYSFSLYVGPLDINILKQQGANLEKAIDFGYFDIIAKPLLLSLIFFSRYIGNYGVSIILITIIIKILFWPLTNKSMKSMKGMQNIQPEIAKLKEKYSNNKEEFAKQQMALYKKYKVNPLGGCLPMLLQIPVFIALYRVLGESIELRHANFISFWINDLSAKDPTYIAPILMGISMLLQQKMTPSSADPAQAKMMMFMPVIFTVMFLNFPSGLVIYWLTNNVLSILQQLYINKKSNVSGGT